MMRTTLLGHGNPVNRILETSQREGLASAYVGIP
jgi:hypothetical protein